LFGKGGFMPTQEEKIVALEQAQTKISEDISDLNHHMTMLIGIVSRQEWDMKEIKTSSRSLDSRLTSFEQSVNSRFEAQDKKLDTILDILKSSN
jgi:peptidoglycan hydrolase CwlO-like protein